ncbi:hypothetical protein, partial [Halomonas cupida]|uniref:hypothetical protein n=1 Tax=Halomonas cupida TaxID=44933 RepID=UPI003A8E4029
AHLRQCGADDNQIDQDELFDCHVNNRIMQVNDGPANSADINATFENSMLSWSVGYGPALSSRGRVSHEYRHESGGIPMMAMTETSPESGALPVGTGLEVICYWHGSEIRRTAGYRTSVMSGSGYAHKNRTRPDSSRASRDASMLWRLVHSVEAN